MANLPVFKTQSGRIIPSIGLGFYLSPPQGAAALVERALELGYRHVDSARSYGNEAEVAQGIANFLKANPHVKRSDIYFTTKLWIGEFEYSKAKTAIANTLERTKCIEYVDLFLIHTPDKSKSDRLDAYRAMQEAVAEGSVKDIGVSNYGAHHVKELLEWDGLKVKPSVNQIEINPWLQHQDILDLCKQHDIIVEAYSPLMRGKNLDNPELVALAKKYNKTVAQILVRWNLQKGLLPLPKSVNEDRLLNNLDVDFEISKEDMTTFGDPKAYYVTIPAWDPTVYP